MTGTGAPSSPPRAAAKSATSDNEDADDNDEEMEGEKAPPKGSVTRSTGDGGNSGPKEAPKAKPKEVPDVDMDDLTGAMSSLAFIPRSVKFGRGGKSGFARR